MTRLPPPASALMTIGCLLLAGPAWAADWTVDPARSTLGFTSSQAGEAFQGQFKHYTATISFDPAQPQAGHVVVLVDMASAQTGDKERDGFLPGGDWFYVSKFAEAKFEATKFVPKGGDAYDAEATLTIRGVTQNVTLPFKLTITGNTAHAVGGLTLNRTKFGVGQGQWTTADWVPFEVGVTIDLTATKAGS